MQMTLRQKKSGCDHHAVFAAQLRPSAQLLALSIWTKVNLKPVCHCRTCVVPQEVYRKGSDLLQTKWPIHKNTETQRQQMLVAFTKQENRTSK